MLTAWTVNDGKKKDGTIIFRVNSDAVQIGLDRIRFVWRDSMTMTNRDMVGMDQVGHWNDSE